MQGLNKVTLIGNLGKDPEVTKLSKGGNVAKLSLATQESYRDKDGKLQTQTDWHKIVAWQQLAEIAEKLFHKGSQVYVEGRLKSRSYEDKEGKTHYITEIVAEKLLILDKAKSID